MAVEPFNPQALIDPQQYEQIKTFGGDVIPVEHAVNVKLMLASTVEQVLTHAAGRSLSAVIHTDRIVGGEESQVRQNHLEVVDFHPEMSADEVYDDVINGLQLGVERMLVCFLAGRTENQQ